MRLVPVADPKPAIDHVKSLSVEEREISPDGLDNWIKVFQQVQGYEVSGVVMVDGCANIARFPAWSIGTPGMGFNNNTAGIQCRFGQDA